MASVSVHMDRYEVPKNSRIGPFRIKRRNTLAEHMFSASPPAMDMRWLHRNDRFVAKLRRDAYQRDGAIDGLGGVKQPRLSRSARSAREQKTAL